MNHELKIRAKRLRRAVSVVLGQDIKTSQSLELVAREENYPNWDAACACAGESARSAVDMIITDTRESHWSIEGLVKEHSQVLDLLQQITDPGSPKGALVVVGGVIGVGKSTTLHRLLAYLAGHYQGVRLLFAGIQEYPLPSGWHVRRLHDDRTSFRAGGLGTPLLVENLTEEFVVLFDVRNDAEAEQAVMGSCRDKGKIHSFGM
ncbi:glyoxalase superfamily protein [Pseudomonas aeruginosa]|nr:glyoxalase superfamily protein [Pseudomonas aeruginosa]